MRFSLQLDELAFSLQVQQTLLHGQQSCLGPAIFISLFEFKSNICCQTTSLGAIHYFSLPTRIFHFSREFTPLVCQENCCSAAASSSLSVVQHVANLWLPGAVGAQEGPGERHLCGPGHSPLSPGKPSCFPTGWGQSR